MTENRWKDASPSEEAALRTGTTAREVVDKEEEEEERYAEEAGKEEEEDDGERGWDKAGERKEDA